MSQKRQRGNCSTHTCGTKTSMYRSELSGSRNNAGGKEGKISTNIQQISKHKIHQKEMDMTLYNSKPKLLSIIHRTYSIHKIYTLTVHTVHLLPPHLSILSTSMSSFPSSSLLFRLQCNDLLPLEFNIRAPDSSSTHYTRSSLIPYASEH